MSIDVFSRKTQYKGVAIHKEIRRLGFCGVRRPDGNRRFPNQGSRGERLRRARKERGLTLTKLAKAVRTTTAHVSLIERNKKAPGRELLFRLAGALGVSVQFIEMGELSPDEAAKVARMSCWPEIIYTIVHQAIVPRRSLEIIDAPGVRLLRPAFDAACSSRHLCEFSAWCTGTEGKALAASSTFADAVDAARAAVLRKGRDDTVDWSFLASVRARLDEWTPGGHNYMIGGHAPSRSPWHCIDTDLAFVYKLYRLIVQGVYLSEEPDHYETSKISPEFVATVFPKVFWAAARSWSDRRLATWFLYLNVDSRLFTLLTAAARQFSSPESFAHGAALLLKDVHPLDADAFVAMFPDVLHHNDERERLYGAGAPRGLQVSERHSSPAWGRRIRQRKRSAAALLDYIYSHDDLELEAQAAQSLKDLASKYPYTVHEDILITPDITVRRAWKPRLPKQLPEGFEPDRP